MFAGLNSKCLKKGDPAPPSLAPGAIRIYSNRFCPFAERVLIYVSAKGLSAEVVNIHLQNKPEWFSEKNSIGKVPAVEVDDEITVESGLIPEYLDDRFPSKRILPAEPYSKYQQKLLVDKLSSIPMSFYGLMQFWKNPSLKGEKFISVIKAMENAEGLLHDEFFGGSSPGYADYMMIPFFIRHQLASELGHAPLDPVEFPGKEFPRLTGWYKRTIATETVADVIQPKEVAKEFLKGFIQGQHYYDIGL